MTDAGRHDRAEAFTEDAMGIDTMGADRRGFLKAVGGAAAAAAVAGPVAPAAVAAAASREEKLKRLASNGWSVRHLFKQREFPSARGMTEEQKKRREQFQQERDTWRKKYGEITLLDFPQFTRDTYPGVTKMDLFSGHFGDIEDDSQFLKAEVRGADAARRLRPLAAVVEEVPRPPRRGDREDRRPRGAHLEQRPAQPRRPRRGEAPRGHRDGEALARRRRPDRRPLDALQHRRAEDHPRRPGRPRAGLPR